METLTRDLEGNTFSETPPWTATLRVRWVSVPGWWQKLCWWGHERVSQGKQTLGNRSDTEQFKDPSWWPKKEKQKQMRDMWCHLVKRSRDYTLEPGLRLGFMASTWWPESFWRDLAGPSLKDWRYAIPEMAHQLHERPVQRELGDSQRRRPQWPYPRTLNVALGTWNVSSLGGSAVPF